jgi:perosamine synthetase
MNEFDNVTEMFEAEIAKYIGCKHVVAVNNGTAAIHTALLASAVQDVVITTPFTFQASIDPIIQVGALPVFCDIDPKTFCLDPKEVIKTVSEDYSGYCDALLGVDLFGNTENLPELREVCDDFGLLFIEDASQAFGASKDGKKAGSFGDVGTFSFYASKNLSTFEGGALVTDDDDIAERARMIRNHGFNDKGEKVMEGFNYKIPRLCSFIGLTNLRLHKKGIESELGLLSPKNGYYPHVVYDNQYYMDLGVTGHCPVAEEIARKVRMKEF